MRTAGSPKGCFLFANAVEYEDSKGEGLNGRNSIDPGDFDSPSADREEYVMWGFSARPEKFGLAASVEPRCPEDLKTAAMALMKSWNPSLRRLVQQTSDLSLFSVKTSVPVSAWETTNVTLLEDALHNMTPFRGMGANMALRDAAGLRRALVKVARGESLLLKSLAGYEREMIEYGFRAVRRFLENMDRVHSEGLRKVFAKCAFRLINAVPAFKERFRNR
jgi:2-polyprenyl-6-methoxyphenol hydroxylase-like FAD-dependent oxidoreductase